MAARTQERLSHAPVRIRPARLTLQPVRREPHGNEEWLHVVLAHYALLSPEAIALNAGARSRLRELLRTEPLALIESWSVDPDYRGRRFRAVWRNRRGGPGSPDPLRVILHARIAVPRKPGARCICVRAIDAFGCETEATQLVADPMP